MDSVSGNGAKTNVRIFGNSIATDTQRVRIPENHFKCDQSVE